MKEYRQCVRCIMDNKNDPDLVIDAKGICNHCYLFDEAYAELPKGSEREKVLAQTIEKIKDYGKKNEYDCLIGISGGVDSTYLAYLCKKMALRPLIVHFDNGWNSELAVKNIEHILSKLKFNLNTYVVDWHEFKDLQLSYFKAGVVDLEFPTDHAIIASMFELARKNNIKYILSGHNIVTEGTYMPKSWVHSKLDFINLKDIHKKHGIVKLKTIPHLSFARKMYYNLFSKFKYIQLLNLVEYNKKEIKKLLIKELDWKDYGGKHFESVFTRFFQGYILPKKFNIDKRVFHYSCLIQSGQIQRHEALELMQAEIYELSVLDSDYHFVLKKLGFTEKEFGEYMKATIHRHDEYKTEQQLWDVYFKVIKIFKPIKRLFKG